MCAVIDQLGQGQGQQTSKKVETNRDIKLTNSPSLGDNCFNFSFQLAPQVKYSQVKAKYFHVCAHKEG